ncbi:MAG: DUF222 domain-containing protein [Rhodococcus sp. (in: high G+C Gram-positive bacteria)]
MVTNLASDIALTAQDVLVFVARVQRAQFDVDAATGIDIISALETAKCACVAAQAVVTDAVAIRISNERKERGKPKPQWRRGIASQIGLARRESPHRGGTHLGLARALVHEMPHTMARLRAGDLNEWRAMILVRETACLTAEDRGTIDECLCADPATLAGAGDRKIVGRAGALANQLDAASQVKRRAKAYSNRRTSTRPAPDSMCSFTTLTSMERAVGMWATLRRDADTIINAGGETRTRDQIMADLVFERITGVSAAAGSPVTVNVVLPDTALLSGNAGSAHLQGYGDIPSDVAQKLVREALDSETRVALRRLYANPETGALTAMESKSRTFPTALARLIDVRDRTCRTPWCDAPIRHHDHIVPHAAGGRTTAENGAGLCAACNYAKEGEGWKARPERTGRRELHKYGVMTPTGHTYISTASGVSVIEHYTSQIENGIVFDIGVVA